ncbi:MAG TPA: HEAT repeat domain-containing protein [Planctomycetaceae bacterium]|nr:HEAT repeat domain-containing protein [Planctomycetaceae bacterium]
MHIQPGDKQIRRWAVPLLTQALKDPRAHVRAEAASTLGELGHDATSSLPALRQLLDDPSPDVRSAADEAIRQIESPAAK